LGFNRCMKKIVRNMCKKSTFWPKELDGSERFADGGVGWVRIVAECVEEQNVEAGQFFETLSGDIAVIGEVGAIAKAEAVDGALAMAGGDGCKNKASRADGFVFKDVRVEPRAAGLSGRGIEDVAEGALYDSPRFSRGIDGYLLSLHKVKRADII